MLDVVDAGGDHTEIRTLVTRQERLFYAREFLCDIGLFQYLVLQPSNMFFGLIRLAPVFGETGHSFPVSSS